MFRHIDTNYCFEAGRFLSKVDKLREKGPPYFVHWLRMPFIKYRLSNTRHALYQDIPWGYLARSFNFVIFYWRDYKFIFLFAFCYVPVLSPNIKKVFILFWKETLCNRLSSFRMLNSWVLIVQSILPSCGWISSSKQNVTVVYYHLNIFFTYLFLKQIRAKQNENNYLQSQMVDRNKRNRAETSPHSGWIL